MKAKYIVVYNKECEIDRVKRIVLNKLSKTRGIHTVKVERKENLSRKMTIFDIKGVER